MVNRLKTNRILLVGICGGQYGNSSTGKTTAAAALEESLGFSRLSLMDVVKKAAVSVAASEVSPEIVDAVCRSGRRIEKDYWLNLTMKGAKDGCSRIVLDDLYFANEAEFVRKSGGVVLCIVRDGIPDDKNRDFTPDITLANIHSSPEKFKEFVVNVVSQHFRLSQEPVKPV